MVPAFGGLLAPHWRNDARGCIVGITALHHKGHICRAALEATAYQTKDVFDAIIQDSNIPLSSLNVDGGGTYNKLLMQFQADILNVKVVRPKIMETTSIGVAFAAGLTIGIWKDVTEIQQLWSMDTVYEPQMSEGTRQKYISGWNKALSKSFNWTTPHVNVGAADDNETTTATKVIGPTEISTGSSSDVVTDTKVNDRDDHDHTTAIQETDLGSSWMVVPSSSSISSPTLPLSSSSSLDVNPETIAAEPVEIPNNTDNEVKPTLAATPLVPISDASSAVDVITLAPTNDKGSKEVSTEVKSSDVSKENEVVEANTTTGIPASRGIDRSTNTTTSIAPPPPPPPSTVSSSHNTNPKNGFDILTLISAVGVAFTAGMLISRKR
jgi:hypothetical protein